MRPLLVLSMLTACGAHASTWSTSSPGGTPAGGGTSPMTAAAGGGTSPVGLELGELRFEPGASASTYNIHADGKLDHDGDPRGTITLDGKLTIIGPHPTTMTMAADGTVTADDGTVLATFASDGTARYDGKTYSVAADGTILPPMDNGFSMVIDYAKTPGQRRTALYFYLGMMAAKARDHRASP
jgi:hypothetical protein